MRRFDFTCNGKSSVTSFPHYWEHCVGSCHAAMALRSDWQKQLYRCHTDLGFKYVRFHGVLNDEMSVIVKQKKERIYSFFNTDQIFDFLLSIDVRPFVELSFMPTALASGEDAVFHYKGNITPPKSYKDWNELITKLVTHWLQRYGFEEVRRWFFEVWNEPNLRAFWKGTKSDYFELYQNTANTLKAIHPELQVGGPATAKCAWIDDFLNFCETNKVPVDFISTHHYPTDALGTPDEDTISQLARIPKDILRKQVQQVMKQARNKPVYFTEWSGSSNPFDELHDQAYTAAFVIKTIFEAAGKVNGYSYWTFSDIFEENYFSSVPFHGGFGLMNIYGIPKPAYRAFELLHKTGTELLKVDGTHPTVDVWIVKHRRITHLIITNWALPKHKIKEEHIKIKLENFGNIKTSFIERIDDKAANANSRWIEMGKPDSLNAIQVYDLEMASKLIKYPFEIQANENFILLDLSMPAQGSACITLEAE